MVAIRDDGEYNELLAFFVSRFLRLHEPAVTYSVLAHFFLACVHRLFQPLPKALPWITGRTGDGKSFLVQSGMNLYGDFPEGVEEKRETWTSTVNYLNQAGAYYKDAVFFVDDYKVSNLKSGTAGVKTLIANYFDGSGRGTLTKDRKINQPAIIRGHLITTGEDTPPPEAATLSRVNTIQYSVRQKDLTAGRELLKRQSEFKGLLPTYIHWVLNQDVDPFTARYHELRDHLATTIAGAQNELRIAAMNAQSGLGFDLLARFLVSRSIWTNQDADQRVSELRTALEQRVKVISTAATAEQGCNTFLRVLGSLIVNGTAIIEDRQSYKDEPKENYKGVRVGFCDEKYPDSVFVLPDISMAEVQKLLRANNSDLGFSKETIGVQLKGEGHLTAIPTSGSIRRMKRGETNDYYWEIKAESLGLELFPQREENWCLKAENIPF